MPRQDPQGRWISDDGLQYWDGTAWRPFGVQAPRTSSALPVVLIGCGFVLVVGLVLTIVTGIFVFNSADFQRAYCNGYTRSNANNVCPFHPSPP
ncbi:MAG TPA: hypothetical protein VIO37_09465 [Candidatus Dormibacteraeota bacterium]